MVFRQRTPYLNRRLGMPLLGRVLCATLGISGGVVILAAGLAGFIMGRLP